MKLMGNILGTSLGESVKEFLKRDKYFFHSNNFLYPVHEIRKKKWRHGHLSVNALQRFSHGKNDRSELKFFAHLPQTSLMGKHEKNRNSFHFFDPVCGQFPQWDTSGTHKNTPNAPVFRPPRGQIFFKN